MTTIRPHSHAAPRHRDLPITYGRLQDFPDDPIACMRRLRAEHGNLAALEEDGQRIVFVFGPELNQRVLADSNTFHSRFFSLRGPKKSSQRRLTSGLLSMNGEQHKQHRRLVMGPFQKRAITGYHDRICQLAADMLDGWQVGQVRDMHAEMVQFMLRVTSGILFGVEEPELAYRLGEQIDRWVHMNHETGIGAFVSDPSYNEKYERLLTLAEELEVDVKRMIDAKRSSRSAGQDVLSLLIEGHDREGGPDDDQLVGHTALLFGAAHLTTAHTFTWTLMLLSEHPAVAGNVQDEIEATLSGPVPEPEEVGRLSLTDRVIRESMRVLPASAYSQRINVEPVELGPLRLPVGTPVIFSQYMTHHMPELYAEPESFRPERWLEISPSAYAYLPFGAGPRMCIGAPLGNMILKTALPMMLKRFRLSLVPGAEIDGKVTSTMLGPCGSVPMLVSRPDGRFSAVPIGGNIHTLVDLPEARLAEARPSRRAA